MSARVSMRHALVIQTAFLGDVVLTTPLIATLQKNSPGVQIDFVTTPAGAAILEGIPNLFIHVLDKKKCGAIRGILSILRSVKSRMRSEGFQKFDFVYCVHRSPRSLLIGRLLPALRRKGFNNFFSKILGYESVNYPPYQDSIHYRDKVLALLDSPVEFVRNPYLVSSEFEQDRLNQLIYGKEIEVDSYIVLSPFSAWGTKMWPWENFRDLAVRVSKSTGLAVIIVGGGDSLYGKKEEEIGRTIAAAVQEAGQKSVNLVGKTTLSHLKALLKGARLLIANDSAPIHIAAAFQCPVVAIFGPTVRRWGFFPLSERSSVAQVEELNCRPCSIHGPNRCPKRHFQCMLGVSVDAVHDLASRLILF